MADARFVINSAITDRVLLSWAPIVLLRMDARHRWHPARHISLTSYGPSSLRDRQSRGRSASFERSDPGALSVGRGILNIRGRRAEARTALPLCFGWPGDPPPIGTAGALVPASQLASRNGQTNQLPGRGTAGLPLRQHRSRFSRESPVGSRGIVGMEWVSEGSRVDLSGQDPP